MPMLADRRGPVERKATDLLRNAQVVAVEVDDPYALEPGDKVLAFRSLRDDPIERLFVRGMIDAAQRDAGAAYRRDLELAEFGGARAIDPTKEAVDGGRFVEPFTDLQRKATARLIEAGRVLGLFAESILRAVVSGNLFPGQVAVARGFTTKRDQSHYRWIFRKALEQLSEVYGTASGQRMGPGY
jgi:hypothetical protein